MSEIPATDTTLEKWVKKKGTVSIGTNFLNTIAARVTIKRCERLRGLGVIKLNNALSVFPVIFGTYLFVSFGGDFLHRE